MMLLYKVPNNTWIAIEGRYYLFHHIDGMYSYCTDSDGNVVHLSASANVTVMEPEGNIGIREDDE
jgi:hypothetical protein